MRALCIGALVLASALSVTFETAAQWCPAPADADTLARVCAHEVGPDATNDCIVIHAALQALAAHRALTWLESAWAYSPRALGARTGRPWVADLQRVCRVPEGWTAAEDGPWSRYEPRIADLFDATDRIIVGKLESPCYATVHDWGCRDCGDHERAMRLGLLPVYCGETVQDYWARPTMRRREERWRR